MMVRLLAILVAALIGVAPGQADVIRGTAQWRERIALGSGVTLAVVLADTARADAPAAVIGRSVIDNAGNPPVAFQIDYDPAAMAPQGHYTLRATLTHKGRLLFSTDQGVRVLFEGAPRSVDLLLRPVPVSEPEQAPGDLPRLISGEVRLHRDGPALRECLTGRVFPLEPGGAFAGLEAAVRAHRSGPEAVVLASVEGRVITPPMSAGVALPRLAVDRFIAVFPGESCDQHRATAGLVNTYWKILALEGASLAPAPGRREPHLLLRGGEDAGFAATVGCNRIVGGYRLAGSALTFEPGAMTRMACPPPLDLWEERLRATLAHTQNYDLGGQVLTLRNTRGRAIADFRAVYLP